MQETTRLVTLIPHLGRYASILTISLCLLLPGVGWTQPAQDAPVPGQTSAEKVESAGESWGEAGQPANFVRSKGPAKDGNAYNWLQMVYAGGVMLIMVGFMIWLIRRTPAKRVTDPGPQE